MQQGDDIPHIEDGNCKMKSKVRQLLLQLLRLLVVVVLHSHPKRNPSPVLCSFLRLQIFSSSARHTRSQSMSRRSEPITTKGFCSSAVSIKLSCMCVIQCKRHTHHMPHRLDLEEVFLFVLC